MPAAVLSTSGGIGNTGSDTLTVLFPPSIAKVFAPAVIAAGGTSTLTFTVTNSNAATALTGVAVTDPLPGDLRVAAAPNAGTAGCGSPFFAHSAGAASLTLTGATIAAGGVCTVTVDVSAARVGSLVNTTSNVSSANGGTGNTGSATLVVGPAAAPLILASKASDFDPRFDDLDGSGSLSPGDTLQYTIEIANSGSGDALAVVLTDVPDANTTLIAGSVTTSQGVVTEGNQPGDAGISVNLGTLPAIAGRASISFTVQLAESFPDGTTTVSNQGSIHGANFPDQPTDDPSTVPAEDDPTVDVVDVGGTADIPTLSPWGIVIFALAIGLAALSRRV